MNESILVPREEMGDLDWLARNVHVWPHITPKVISAGDELFEFGATFYNDWVDIYGKFAGCGVTVTKQQWLSRRAELQNKPSWCLSGSWSKYLAQDMDGEWKWLGENPSLGDEYWTADELRSQCKGVVIGDWRDTLEKRPEEFKPFASIEDNQEQDMAKQQEMKQDSGWFERGELPPVGVECEVMHRERWVVCDVIAHFQQKVAMVAAYTVDNGNALKNLDSCIAKYFRPIRTERDVLIEIIKKTDDTDDRIADAILAAGFSLGAK